MITPQITATGNTCGCCVDSVRDELGPIPGTGAVPISSESIGAAVDRAGGQVTE